jgi:hypothetical protein
VKISAVLRGGLGNQLFILAASLEQSKRLEVPLRLLSQFNPATPHANLQIHSLNLGSDIQYSEMNTTEFNKRHKLANLKSKFMGLRNNIFVEESFAFDPSINTVQGGDILFGYFQSWKYSPNSRFVITSAIDSLEFETTTAKKLATLLGQNSDIIALHLRLGDYLTADNSAIFGSPSLKYINAAIQNMKNAGGRKIWVFSDDIGLAKELLRKVQSCYFVTGTSAFDDLKLMGNVNFLITANSSFSWWAGSIVESRGGAICSPNPWFVDNKLNTQDLLPPTWIVLDR